jgi:c(7)-type cytochrome triheme protein
VIGRFAALGGALVLTVLVGSTALAIEGVVVFSRKAQDRTTPPARFPHWVHRIRYKCYACHPTPFPMKAGATDVTMDAIREGKFCGRCHNGKIAWEVSFDTCSRCHVEQ